MMTKKLMAAGLLVLPLTTGCAGPGALGGAFYQGYTLGASAGPSETATKSGEACAASVLGLVAFGDGSVDSAKKKGGITKVATIDHETFSVLGIYASVCTVVTGD